METYTITDEQWQKVNAALNVAISVCLVHKREFMAQMLEAGNIMDDIANASGDLAEED